MEEGEYMEEYLNEKYESTSDKITNYKRHDFMMGAEFQGLPRMISCLLPFTDFFLVGVGGQK